MEEFGILSFKFGLDTRKDVLTSQPGTLVTCENAHVNPGGELEKRKAFDVYGNAAILDGNADTGTFGLEVTEDGIVVFGSALAFGTTPTQSQPVLASAMPAGVTYQQLKHPTLVNDTGEAYSRTLHRITSVPFSENFNGKAFVAATFADGRTFLYYDGELIQQSANGVVMENRLALADLSNDLLRQVQAIDWAGEANKAGDALKVTSITSAGTTATVTITGHGFANGDLVEIVGADQPQYNGIFTIAGVAANTFTYTMVSAPTISPATSQGNGEILAIKSGVTQNGSTLVQSPALNRFTPIIEDTSTAGQIGAKQIVRDGQSTSGTRATAAFQITVNTGTFTVEAPETATSATPTVDLGGGAIAAVVAAAKLTADAIAASINDLTFIHGYTAATNGDVVIVSAPIEFGVFTLNLTITTTTGTVTSSIVTPPNLVLDIVPDPAINIQQHALPGSRLVSVSAKCSPMGGTPPYSFVWSEVSVGSGNGMNISNGNTDTATFSKVFSDFISISGAFKCTVTDSSGTPVTLSRTLIVILGDQKIL